MFEPEKNHTNAELSLFGGVILLQKAELSRIKISKNQDMQR